MPTTSELIDYAIQVFKLSIINGKRRSFDDCLQEALYIYTGEVRFRLDDNHEGGMEKGGSPLALAAGIAAASLAE